MSRPSKDLADSERPRVLVIGSANVDLVMGLPRLPNKGETVTDGVFLQTFGGKGANQAVAVRRAGAAVTFLCCLGEDSYGESLKAHLEADGIDMSWSIRTSAAATGTALVMYDRSGENYLSVAPGANYELESAHVERCINGLQEIRMIVLQYEITERALRASFLAAARAGIPILFNHAPARALEIDWPLSSSGVVVNEIEARMITGIEVQDPTSAELAARLLRHRGYRFAVVTLGEKGCVVCSEESQAHIPALKVATVDTTAAGDCFCGTLAASLVEGATLIEAANFATIAASICVQRAGAQPSIPWRADIDIEVAHLAGQSCGEATGA